MASSISQVHVSVQRPTTPREFNVYHPSLSQLMLVIKASDNSHTDIDNAFTIDNDVDRPFIPTTPNSHKRSRSTSEDQDQDQDQDRDQDRPSNTKRPRFSPSSTLPPAPFTGKHPSLRDIKTSTTPPSTDPNHPFLQYTGTPPSRPNCPICLEDLNPLVTESICRHAQCSPIFHVACLEQWAAGPISTCPACRGRLCDVEAVNWELRLGLEDRVFIEVMRSLVGFRESKVVEGSGVISAETRALIMRQSGMGILSSGGEGEGEVEEDDIGYEDDEDDDEEDEVVPGQQQDGGEEEEKVENEDGDGNGDGSEDEEQERVDVLHILSTAIFQ